MPDLHNLFKIISQLFHGRFNMKKLFITIPLIVVVLGLTAGRIIDDKMNKILQQLQINENDARDLIWSNCGFSNFYIPNPRALKNIAAGEKASVVETVAKYVKDFATAPDFLNKYNQLRENKKPKLPEKPKTTDEMKDEQRESYQEAIKSMKETKSKMPSDQQGMFDETIKQYEEQLKEIDNPDNPMFSKEVEDMYKQVYDQQMVEYNGRLAEWEQNYPENKPASLIKDWLTKFLDESKDVDFSAITATDQYNKQVFVKQEYEKKSPLWKLCYRAGKEATDAGRRFAQQWLSEL
jgi:hypothetical protein